MKSGQFRSAQIAGGVAASGEENIRVWPLQISDLLSAAHTATGRNFSEEEWALFFQGQPYRRTFPDLPAPQLAK